MASLGRLSRNSEINASVNILNSSEEKQLVDLAKINYTVLIRTK